MIGNKPKKSLDDITRDLCPVLSIQQLYRISTMYWDDKYNTETVSSEVCWLHNITMAQWLVVRCLVYHKLCIGCGKLMWTCLSTRAYLL